MNMSNSSTVISKIWGVFPWHPEHGLHHIFDEDVSLANRYLPTSCVFKCVGRCGDYLKLNYKTLHIRVKPDLFQEVSGPITDIGGRVKVLTGSAKGKEAVIENLAWHFNKKEIIYSLKIDGKLSSRQYFASDIELLN